jgi:hypothetical protein
MKVISSTLRPLFAQARYFKYINQKISAAESNFLLNSYVCESSPS